MTARYDDDTNILVHKYFITNSINQWILGDS